MWQSTAWPTLAWIWNGSLQLNKDSISTSPELCETFDHNSSIWSHLLQQCIRSYQAPAKGAKISTRREQESAVFTCLDTAEMNRDFLLSWRVIADKNTYFHITPYTSFSVSPGESFLKSVVLYCNPLCLFVSVICHAGARFSLNI